MLPDLPATIFGVTVTLIFLFSLKAERGTKIVAALLFAGWLLGQVSQGLFNTYIPLGVYVALDFFSAELLFFLFAFYKPMKKLWVFGIAATYTLMMAAHASYVLPLEELLGFRNPSNREYYWMLSSLFAVQLGLTGWQVYRDRKQVDSNSGNHSGFGKTGAARHRSKEAS